MALIPGTRLGPYEVIAQIGVGGMGEVYRATDSNLKRSVAIKVLPASVAGDADRLARLQREAEMLAALNHANIAAIYGLERGPNVTALVMELVEGEDLSQRIARGAMPLDEALPIAKQIAEALEAAHEQGIIHRDLKPANIKVRSDGTVKVLDFGLAKAMEPAVSSSPSLSMSPTITTPAMTQAGMILGTAAYMAPEQARGKAVNRRADIWAFGAVLFEMLTGQRAFGGEDTTGVIGAVVHLEPNWEALPSGVPPLVRALLQSCLVKESRRRVADISTALFVLEKMASPASGGTASLARIDGTPLGRRRVALTAGTLLAAAAGLAIVGGYWLRRAPMETPFKFSMPPPEGTSFLHVSQGGAPAISPDGQRIAFVAEGRGGRLLWLCSLDGFNARLLAGTEGGTSPFWSPDGRWIAFYSRNGLEKVDPETGQVQLVSDSVSRYVLGGTSNAAGEILYTPRVIGNVLGLTNASGGQPSLATERNVELLDENHLFPSFLPDGRHYLLVVRGGPQLDWSLWLGVRGSNDRRLLLKGTSNAQYAPPRLGAPGQLVFARNGNLMAQPFDASQGTLFGAAATVAEHVAVTLGLADFTVSPSGVLAYRTAEPAPHELVWYDRSGKEVGTIGDRPGNPRNNVRISPDGKAIAFTRQSGETQDIWIHDLVRGITSRLTSNEGRSPVWSPDGSQIAFVRQDTIYRMPVTGAGAEEMVWRGPHLISVNDWSGDGKYLLFTRWNEKGVRQTWFLSEPLASAATKEPVLLTNGIHAQFAPATGPPQWISYDEGGQTHIRTVPGGVSGSWQVSTEGGNGSRFRRDGRELYFSNGQALEAVDIDSGPLYRVNGRRALFPIRRAILAGQAQYAQGWDVTDDGSRFLATFPDPETPASTITVVKNWQVRLGK